ncbi:uncharacterized protein E0L32_010364 [Thyridium curvatum]|uniref:S-adenosyl-L-methionine-dependent methyltransferase n=1 Tax=Thyridium curvatum TaxID=1093900 RepID=A0A507ASM8_9PEZI|nr:uncharacterized protein E0L32_010364 [Thyridium curvatum]TPX07909.1 hypothetical protein E0L32_010364 [Thyridium curvatum]
MDSGQAASQPSAAATTTSSSSIGQDESAVMNSMYQVDWVQKLLMQIKECLRQNSDWLGIDPSKPQTILDYACGNGTVSLGLLDSFPLAKFRGIDILDSQVQLYNEEASKVLGPDHRSRMYAIPGDLNDPEKTPVLSQPEWFTFDCAIMSFGLHHVDDPIDFLRLLGARVKPGATLVIVDWVRDTKANPPRVYDQARERKYNPSNMLPVPMGKVWPGFSEDDIREDYTLAGFTAVEVRIWPEKIDLPQQANFGGRSILYVSKATVPLPP